MELLLWFLVVQGLLGAFDMFYHHELKEKLPWRETASTELILHGVRNYLYSIVFLSLGWIAWHGVYAWVFMAILLTEVFITLWDFVEEDRTRKLPETERVTHTILAVNYGAVLMLFVPIFIGWSAAPSGFDAMNHGALSWVMTVYGIGVFVWGCRDFMRGLRLRGATSILKDIFPRLTKANQNILVTGGTGFVGKRLCQHLIDEGHRVTVFTRNIKNAGELFTGRVTLVDRLGRIHSDEKIDAIINLAGEKVAQRWTVKAKKHIQESRMTLAKQMYELVERLTNKPAAFFQASAIGYYGIDNETEFDENTTPYEDDSYARVICTDLEAEINRIKSLGVRVCNLRIGLVAEKDGGAVRELLIPFDCFAGGPIGHGQQWWSWIHRDDVVGIILHLVNTGDACGAYNATAPHPVSNKKFAKTLAKAMHRPALLPMPAFMVTLLFGEMGNDVMLHGQKVVPTKTIESGYQFIYPEIEDAFEAIFSKTERGKQCTSHIDMI